MASSVVSILQKSDGKITMDITQDMLENLKCSICENYLSRSPVYLETGEAAVCGQCISPDRLAFRNKQYETLAKVMMFPCKNRDFGCLEKVPFAEESENLNHEEVCPYRQYVCPIMGSTHCEWVGTSKEFSKHCEEQHEDRIQDSPITLTYDISKSEQKNFLLRAFQVLFLLHTKVCVTSGKIYHAIRYLGPSDEAQNFNFNVDIQQKTGSLLSRKGFVTEQGCLAIQEDTSLVLKINSLLDVLGGLKDTTFTIKIDGKLPSAIINCFKCGVLVTDLVHRIAEGWCCAICAPIELHCSCGYQDTIQCKLSKHVLYFCSVYKSVKVYCTVCDNNHKSRDSLLEHYKKIHKNKMYHSGYTWRMKWSKSVSFIPQTFFVGTVACTYYFSSNKKLNLILIFPVASNQLHKFKCTISITQTTTGRICVYKPEILYNQLFDRELNITEADFPNWNNEFEVCVDITEIDT